MTDLHAIVVRPSDSVRVHSLGDEISLFDAATGTAFALNRTAADVLALADGSTSLGEIVDTLARAYRVAPGEIVMGVRSALGQLIDAGVLVADG